MKIIKVASCSTCPYFKIQLYCAYSGTYRAVIADTSGPQPKWCPLEDAEPKDDNK